MSALKVLFIGGSGIISSACSQRAADLGLDLTVLNRGETTLRPIPDQVRVLHADVRDAAAMRSAVGSQDFDVVVDWLAFTPAQVQADIDLFTGRTGQYVFISSASAYQKPPARLPIIESTPLRNPIWRYSQEKIACEDVLVHSYRDIGFPATIVRPSHTYDKTLLPCEGGWTVVDRMRAGKDVIVHGDGTSLWTLTHHIDFAKGFVGLLGDERTIGDSFQITSDEALTWDRIYRTIAAAAGTEANIVHIASDAIAAVDSEWGDGLLGDKAHSAVFDNSKLRTIVPDYSATISFDRGAREIIDWYDEDESRRVVDHALSAKMDQLIDAYHPRPNLG